MEASSAEDGSERELSPCLPVETGRSAALLVVTGERGSLVSQLVERGPGSVVGQLVERGPGSVVSQLVVRQPTLAGLALELGRFFTRLGPNALLTPSIVPVSTVDSSSHGSSDVDSSPSESLQSLNKNCHPLVPLHHPLPPPPPLPPSPSPHTVLQALSQTAVCHMPSSDEVWSTAGEQQQIVPTASPLSLSQSLSQLEREELGEDSDDELVMPTEDEVVSSDSHSLHDCSLVEPDLQGPPRKIARLSHEDDHGRVLEAADDGHSTIDQAVPGDGCAQGHTSPARPSPCREQRRSRGEDGGGPEGDRLDVGGDQQVVPSDNDDGDKEAGPLTSLFGQEHSKWSPPQRQLTLPFRHTHHCQTCGAGAGGLTGRDGYPSSVQLNMSCPKLRLGLSKCQRLHSLHKSLSSREE